MRVTNVLAGSILIALAVAGGCRKEEPPAPPPVRVENLELGVAIAALSGFEVTANDGATIELVPAGGGATGTVSIAAGDPGIGENLVAAVNRHKAEILERPDGDYKGQAEYVTPLGTAFASRGRYSGEGGTVEERAVFMVHPWGGRPLRVIYRYPAGDDTQARLDALMNGIVGELEGLPLPEAVPAETVPAET